MPIEKNGSHEIIIDGIADDPQWNASDTLFINQDLLSCDEDSTGHFVLIQSNNQYLYVFCKIYNRHIWSNLSLRDEPLYQEDAFEVFLDPAGDGIDYYELEINPLNTLFDLHFTSSPHNGGEGDAKFNFQGIKHDVYIEGTLNDPIDEDSYWSAELAIPLKELGIESVSQIRNLSANFAIVKWPMKITDGRYEKVNPSDLKAAKYICWQCHSEYNMHLPEKWKSLLTFRN